MLDEFERSIALYDLYIDTLPENGPPINIDDVIAALQSMKQKGEAVWLHEHETASVRLVDLKATADNSAYVLLISHSNSRVTDPAFEHIKSGRSRTEPKRTGEGIAYAAHIVIFRQRNGSGAHLPYKMIMEQVPSIGSGIVDSFRTQVCRRAFKETKAQFELNKRKYQYRPIFRILGHMSTTLSDALDTGAISKIELVDFSEKDNGFDEDSTFIERKRTVELTVAPDKELGFIKSSLRKLAKKAKDENYAELRVRIRNEDGRENTISLKTQGLNNALETLAVKTYAIKLDQKIGQSSEAIRDDVVSRMMGRVADTDNPDEVLENTFVAKRQAV